MAQQLSESSIQPNAPKVLEGEVVEPQGYGIRLIRYDAAGHSNTLQVNIPANATLDTIKANPLLLAAVLKDGDPVWKACEPGFILVAVLHAASLGLDILQGDIYPIEGRLAVSDKGKIRHARGTGRYRHEFEIEAGEQISIPWKTSKENGVWVGPNYKGTCRIYDKEWGDKPMTIFTTTLEAWFTGRNPNWRRDPQGMLRLRCVAKAYEEVCPVGTEPSDAPPLDAPASVPTLPQTPGAIPASDRQTS